MVTCTNCHRNKIPGKPHMCEAACSPATCPACHRRKTRVYGDGTGCYETGNLDCTRAQLDAANARLAMAWAFNAGGDVQVRRAGPGGTHWFITRGAGANFDGAALQRDGSWGGHDPQPFADADAAFAALDNARKGGTP